MSSNWREWESSSERETCRFGLTNEFDCGLTSGCQLLSSGQPKKGKSDRMNSRTTIQGRQEKVKVFLEFDGWSAAAVTPAVVEYDVSPQLRCPKARKVGRHERRNKARPKLDAFLKGAVAAHRESQSRVNPSKAHQGSFNLQGFIALCHRIVHKTVKRHRDTSPVHCNLECCYHKELIFSILLLSLSQLFIVVAVHTIYILQSTTFYPKWHR